MPSEQSSDVKFEIGHVLFIDIVGYSKLLINEQSEQIQTLREIVRGTEQFRIAEGEGKLLRLPTGDGGALVFRTSPEAPVLCALEISKELKNHPKLDVRMGIHSGPVNEVTDLNEQANIAGAGVNIAQRVMDCGDAGHILLSKHVAEDLEHYPRWRPYLHPLGECEVKHGVRISMVNFYQNELGNPAAPQKFKDTRPITSQTQITATKTTKPSLVGIGLILSLIALAIVAFIFTPAILRSREKAKSNSGPAKEISRTTIPDKSIAVLPFENLSHDSDNAYLADGIQEEILTRLANISELKVISRTSASKFKSSPDNLREIAAKLGVSNILEGSIQKSADQIRVNVQLIRTSTDAHLWADTYDRKLTDVFVIETEIAKAIADSLKAKLTSREQNAISSHPTESSEAHQLYLKGRFFWNKRTSADLKTSIGYFNQAIEKDPAYARAYAGLADAYSILPNYSQTPGKEAYPKAEAAAMNALEIDEGLAEAHIALANVRLWHKWGNGAEAEFKKGLQLNPNYSTGHQWYSIYLSVIGRLNESAAEMEKAKELDPFSIIINTELGCPYLYLKQYARAIELFKKAIEMEPDFPFAHFALAEAYDQTGRYQEALSEHETALALARREQAFDLGGSDAPKAWYALTGQLQNAYGALSGPNYWKERLESTKGLYEHGVAPATAVAGIYSILGDKEQAFAWLERAYQQSDDFLVFLNIQPQFENLHSDPRFQALVQKVFVSNR